MTVRLRLILDDDVKEFAFDRPTISVGRSPFNDLVVSHDEVAPRHGALSFDRDEGVVFEVDGCGQPTAWLRDGELMDTTQPEGRSHWVLGPGDVLHLGCGKHASIELVFAAVDRAPTIEPLSLDGATMPAVARALEVLGSSAGRLAASDNPSHVLVRAAGALATALGLDCVRRVDVVVFTPSDEFLDDVHGAVVVSGGELSEIVPTRDPILALGNATHAEVRRRLERDHRAVRCVREGRETLVLGVRHADELVGCVVMTHDHPGQHADAFASLGITLRPLAALAMRDHHLLRRVGSLEEENAYFRERERRHYMFKELVCESAAMKQVYAEIERHVSAQLPVLVHGEAGSGKELLARALHHLSPSHDGMFISLHCGRLDGEQLGVELFGCVANPLTGVLAPRKGIFELASPGTVYLEEVELLSPVLQGKLARMLQEGEVRRVGDSVGRKVAAKLVVSTHRPLREIVRSGRLRHELFMALREQILEVPALRDRTEDLLPLARSFLRRFAKRYGKRARTFSPQVQERLLRYDWPGNVRELQTFVEAAVLRASRDATEIGVGDLSI